MKYLTNTYKKAERHLDELYDYAQDLHNENEELKVLLERYLKIESTIPTNASIEVAKLTKDVLDTLSR